MNELSFFPAKIYKHKKENGQRDFTKSSVQGRFRHILKMMKGGSTILI